MLTELILYFVRNLVDKPELVTVTHVQASDKEIIEIKVAAHDLAKVIGREGRTFKALRSLVDIVSQERKDIVIDSIT